MDERERVGLLVDAAAAVGFQVGFDCPDARQAGVEAIAAQHNARIEAPANDTSAHALVVDQPRGQLRILLRFDRSIFVMTWYDRIAARGLAFAGEAPMLGPAAGLSSDLAQLGFERLSWQACLTDLGPGPLAAGLNAPILFAVYFDDG
jgi:hypothetical protein